MRLEKLWSKLWFWGLVALVLSWWIPWMLGVNYLVRSATTILAGALLVLSS